jgi:Mrp family chromosome partitioning ATPase
VAHTPALRPHPKPGADAHHLQARSFQGGLAQLVAERCVDALKKFGHLPQSHRVAGGLLPMQLPRPRCMVGRAADMDAVRLGLRKERCVLLTGGPGEGKSTLACAVGVALWDEGAYQHGAFELDMTGRQRAHVAFDGRAAWPARETAVAFWLDANSAAARPNYSPLLVLILSNA